MARRGGRRRRRRVADADPAIAEQTTIAIDDLPPLIDALANFSPATRTRGAAYYAERRVRDLDILGDSAFAVVRGQRPYVVVWDFDGGGWWASCECPVGDGCKHAFAVGLAILAPELATLPRGGAARVTSWLGRLGNDAARSVVASAPAVVPAGGVGSGAARALETLRGDGLLSLRRAALSSLLEGGPVHGHLVFEVTDELQEKDPDLRCRLLAVAIEARSGGWVPPPLRPYLDRDDLDRQLAVRREEAARRRLMGWLATRMPAEKRHFRAELGLEGDREGLARVTMRVLVTSARLDSVPRTFEQIRQAWSDVHVRGEVIAPPQRLLLDWLVDGLSAGGYSGWGDMAPNAWMLRSVNRLEESGLVTWAPEVDPTLAERAGIVAGTPVSFATQPLRLDVQCEDTSGRELVLFPALRWPDGSCRALEACLQVGVQGQSFGRVETLAVNGGLFYDVLCDLPSEVMSAFEEVGAIRLDVDNDEAVVSRAAGRLPAVAAVVEAHTHHYPVEPIVTLDLRDDDRFEIRVFADATQGAWAPLQPVGENVVFEYLNPNGWMRLAGEQHGGQYAPIRVGSDAGEMERIAAAAETPVLPDSGRVWREAPRVEDVAPLLDWLRSLDIRPLPAPDTAVQGCSWWLPARGKAMERFADLWERAPAGTRFFGNEAARRLLDRGRRVVPRLKVSASGLDWLEVSATWQAEGVALTDEDVAALRKETTKFVRLSSGWVRREVAGEQEEASSLLADLGVEADGAPSRLSVFALAGAAADTLDALARLDADAATLAAVRSLRERIERFTGIPRIAVPRRFRGRLRSYQRDGLDFLAHATTLGVGTLLADDMGLGKTVQTLAWLQWLRDADPQGGPALVVCPASVVHNWIAEAAQFTPRLKVLELRRGSERQEQMQAVDSSDLVVTNYALVRRDAKQWREKKLRALILDEAQNIKNPDAEVTRAVRSIDSRHRLALTGTPIENRTLDLWSIVDCLNPGYLGNRSDFSSRFDGLDLPAHRRTLLAAKLRPILLRRTKSGVAPELPDRIEESRHCELTKGQRQIYLAELAKCRKLVADLGEDPGALRQNKISILAALTRLRQICCHPALVGGKESLGSGKFDGLFEILEPLLGEGHKVLVFSQFVECLKLLEKKSKQLNIPTRLLTGQTANRAAVVRGFEEDTQPCVFLISLKAGGTGLNLTSASYVVLFDPWWNPAVEAQAIDRTHRIGQDRTVIAYRLITEGTIEEKIRELQRRKEGLVRDVLGEGGFARSLNRADLDYLLEPA